MTQESTGLAASYRRRAWCARLGSAAFAAGLVMTLAQAQAQNEGAQVVQNNTQSKQADSAPPTDNKNTTGKSGAKPVGKDSKTSKTTKPRSTNKNKSAGRGAGTSGNPGANTGLKIVPMQGGGAVVPGRGVPQGTVPPGNPGIVPGVPPVPAFPPGNPTGGGAFGGGAFGGGQAGTKFSFEFRGSDIDNVLKLFSTLSNQAVSKDPGLTGQVTILNPKQVTLDEAFRILQSVLYVRGFTALQSNGVIQILPFKGAITSTPLINGGINEDGTTRVDSRNQFMTQVIPIENVDAEALAREFKELASPGASLIGSPGTNSLIITDTASNVARFIALVEVLDKGSDRTNLKIYALTRADASSISQIINDLYSKITSRGKSGAIQPGQPGFQPPQPGQPQAGAASRPAVVAVPDAATNSVLVVASPDNQERIARDIIGRLDGDDNNRLEVVTRKINFADAQTVANLVNSVLTNQRPGGSGVNPSFQQRTFGFFGDVSGGGQNVASSDPLGKVAADPRTNTVLITATKDRLVRINGLIDNLDQDVPVEPTTFVFPLKNAQAQDVSVALGQAFGTGQNNNNNGGFFGGFGGFGQQQQARNPFGRQQQGTGTQRRLGTTTGRGARNQNIPPGPPNAPDQGNGAQGDPSVQTNGGSALPQGIQGVMTDQGFVPTEAPGTPSTDNGYDREKTRQFFGFGGGGRRQTLGQSNSPQFGRGRNGGYSNLLQLQNNVFVTPAPDGESLIVTTVPENYEAVRQIIEALDIVPRQVMIEVIIAEVTLSSDQKLGFSLAGSFLKLFGQSNTAQGQFNVPTPGSGTAFDPVATGGQFVINGANYSALLQALTSDNKVRVLATPRVFASNNQPADINIQTQIPFLQGSQQSAFSSVISSTVQTAPVGYSLSVTPRITRQGLVTIDVQQEADDLVRFQTLGSGVNASTYPVINTRNTDTTVTVQDGETIVIGGLIRDNSALNINKVPILGDIPLIGQFFRSRQLTRDKTELMIFMTPRVVNTVEEARQLTLQQGAPVIRQIPDLSRQQPNLTLPTPPKGVKPDPKAPVIRDSSGKVLPDLNRKKSDGTGTGTGTGGAATPTSPTPSGRPN